MESVGPGNSLCFFDSNLEHHLEDQFKNEGPYLQFHKGNSLVEESFVCANDCNQQFYAQKSDKPDGCTAL